MDAMDIVTGAARCKHRGRVTDLRREIIGWRALRSAALTTKLLRANSDPSLVVLRSADELGGDDRGPTSQRDDAGFSPGGMGPVTGICTATASAPRERSSPAPSTGCGPAPASSTPSAPVRSAATEPIERRDILLFWAALIRATRDVGGPGRQGTAFGALDGGRGLFAASLASLAWVPFQAAFVGDPGLAGSDERVQALRAVILVYTAATFIAAALVWIVIDEDDDAPASTRVDWPRIGTVLVQPAIWLQALIVFAAYCAYKGIDNYSLYLMHAHHLDEVEAAQAIVSIAWLRPVAALGAGVLADRIRPTRVALLGFGALVAGSSALAFTDPGAVTVVWIGLTVTCAAAFGLRGVYFALMGEARVPTAITGTAVGLISMIGFLPENFIAPVSGWLLDRSPGLTGHHEVFLLLTGIGAMGLITTLLLARRLSR